MTLRYECFSIIISKEANNSILSVTLNNFDLLKWNSMVLLRHIQPKVTVPIFKMSEKSSLKIVSLLWAAAPQTKTSFQKCSWSNHIALVASPFNPIRPKRYLFFKSGPKMAIFSSTVFALSLLESLCSNWVNFSWEFWGKWLFPQGWWILKWKEEDLSGYFLQHFLPFQRFYR